MTVPAQNNLQWIIGYQNDPTHGFGLNCLDFRNHEIKVYPYEYQNNLLWIGIGSTFVCDTSGNFVLMSDNCSIYDSHLNIIEGGKQMHHNEFASGYCKPDIKDYGVVGVNVLFPSKTHSDTYYQLYKDLDVIDPIGVLSQNLYFNIIVRDQNGTFRVERQDTLYRNLPQVVPTVSPIYNKQTKRWTFFTIDNITNKYTFFDINEETRKVDTLHSQKIGEPLDTYNQFLLPGIFSPDHKTFSAVVANVGLQVFDFDESINKFSNPRNIFFPTYTYERSSFGICYSPGSQFVYITTGGGTDPLTSQLSYLYQLDLTDNTAELITIFNYVDEISWPIWMGTISQGPDCRLYVSPATTTHWMHVIHHPDRKGAACDFQPMAIDMPYRVNHFLPAYINAGQDCDSTYVWPFPLSVKKMEEKSIRVSVYPNPVTDFLFIESKDLRPGQWIMELCYLNGRTVYRSKKMEAITNQIDISALMPGMYVLRILSREGKLLLTDKIVKM